MTSKLSARFAHDFIKFPIYFHMEYFVYMEVSNANSLLSTIIFFANTNIAFDILICIDK